MAGTPRTRAELEALFESGDQPTQQDFADLIASFLLVNETDFPDPLPAVDASQLTNIPIPDPLPAVSGENLTGINIQEWDPVSPAPNYATTTTFVHAGDLTGTYIKDRRVRLTINGGFEYSDVVSSVYASGADTTTVTIADAMSSNLLTAADVSVFTPLEAGGAISPLMIGSIGAQFRAHKADTPDMTVVVDAGRVQNGITLTEVAQQATATITAPTTNPRIDRVVIDNVTGVVSVIVGAEAASPVAPALTGGKVAICQVLLQASITVITNSIITDERSFDVNPKIETTITNTNDAVPSSAAVFNKVAGLNTKVIEIGDWDMNLTSSVDIPHGLTRTKIRSIRATIRDDFDTIHQDFSTPSDSTISVGLTYITADNTNIQLTRGFNGRFDSITYDATSYNRGWIIIQYTD